MFERALKITPDGILTGSIQPPGQYIDAGALTDAPVYLDGRRVGRVKSWAKMPDIGLWVKAQLDAADSYQQRIRALLSAGKLSAEPAYATGIKTGAPTGVALSDADAEMDPGRRIFYFRRTDSDNSFKMSVCKGLAADCARQMGLQDVRLVWVLPAARDQHHFKCEMDKSYSDLRGFAENGVAYIRADLDISETKAIVAHELRHLYHEQWEREHGVRRPRYDQEEEDAATYARTKARWR